MQTCKTCKWWKEIDADFGEAECRRNAPRPNHGSSLQSTYWPRVEAKDFCGEHTPTDKASE